MFDRTFFTIAAFIFGAIFGSFLNVCICRMPLGQSIVFPTSHCPFCKTRIRFYDNIPLISYIMLRGKCRDCGVFISFRYFTVELLTAVCAALMFARYGFSPLFLIYFGFVSSLIVISFIDLQHRIIPNSISIPGIFIGILVSTLLSYSELPWNTDFKGAILGIAVGGGSLWATGFLYSLVTGREGIGFGDVKLLAMFGAFFGWRGAFFSIFLGSILGMAVGVPVAIAKRKSLKYPIPFGPFLVLGLIIYIWFAKSLLDIFPFAKDFLGSFLPR